MTKYIPYHINYYYALSKAFPNSSQNNFSVCCHSLLNLWLDLVSHVIKLPSWLLYLQIQEILSNFSYALVFNFLESALVVGLIIGLSIFLPQKYFAERFIAQGSLLAILGVGYLMYLANIVGESKANIFPWDTFKLAFIVGGIILILTLLIPRIHIVRKVLEGFADRATVFLYLIVPLSVLGGIIVIINNLFIG